MENNLKTEEDVKSYWEEKGIPRRALRLNENGPKYYFLDGPPYATGSIHMGTAWNKILKDYYLRFWRMRGYNVWSQPGYDTHGLPTEIKVEKKLGIKNKQDIEKIGIDKFTSECREFATKFINAMNDQFADLGVWMDWDNPYLTLKKEYIEGAWYTFKVAYDKGLLYKGKYPVHVCPHCQTVVAYNEIEYGKVEDTSIYVKFRVKGKDNEYLIIWTTTPWTLPANTGVMVHPTETYVKVEVAGETWILAKARLQELVDKLEAGYRILEEFPGQELVGVEYENPLGDLPVQKGIVGRVVPSAQFVTMDTGTGLVHCAPGHGREDYKVGKENGLPQLAPVGLDGKFTSDAGKYSGMYVKDADKLIIDDLRNKGALVFEEKITHDYPKCWRCGSPLIFTSVPQWFFAVSKIKDKLIEEARKTKWYPNWSGRRFEDWLQGIEDWPISRQRYWGIPVPMWVCEKCGKVKVIGSTGELGVKLDDLHRPYIDNVKLKCECGGDMKRVPEVLDVWFDSGVAAWASLGYPEKEEPFKSMWPVDHVLEGLDQIRGWWNSSMISSVITFGRTPFNAVVNHGLILDVHGIKMSKSKGNVVTPKEVVDQYSRDELRFYLLSLDYGSDVSFDWNALREDKKFFTILNNIYRFFDLYGSRLDLPDKLEPEDKWIISRVNSLVKSVTSLSEEFKNYRALKEIERFVVDDLSRTYVKLIRDRTWPSYSGKDKISAQATLYYTLNKLVKLMAPILPYTSERLYLGVLGGENSVHFQKWPEAEEKLINKELEDSMEILHEVVDAVINARQEAGIKLRWPIGRVEVNGDESVSKAVSLLEGTLLKMINAKSTGPLTGEFVEAHFSKGTVRIPKSLSGELVEEALASELIRRIQEKRKKANMSVDEKITLRLSGHPLLKDIKDMVSSKVNASDYVVGEPTGEFSGELNFQGSKIKFAFDKM